MGQGQNGVSNFSMIMGLTNGMIGGTILVLPILGLKSGYINTILVCFLVGVAQFYTAYILIKHMGKASSIKQCILQHFNQDQKYVKIYDFLIWFGFIPLFLIYFRLIALQFEGIIGYSPLIAPIAALVLILVISIIRIWQIGEQALALGIISIIIYVAFLMWAQVTAPKGEKQVPATGNFSPLVSALIMAYSIHYFVTQNILKNQNKQDYTKIVTYTFLLGITVYTFIAYGSYAIVNRQPYKKDPQTIQDYFEMGQWQIVLIEILYLIHLFSAFPNFLIISKIRFYQMFGVQLQNKVSWHQFLYIFFTVGICLLVYIADIHLDVMINLNGSIVGFINSIVFPIILHLNCVYFKRNSGQIQGDDNTAIAKNECQCQNVYKSKWTLYIQTFFLILLIIYGFFSLVNAITQTITQS